MKLNFITTTALAFTAFALVATSAKAQVTFHDGDLLIGFDQAGASNDFFIDVGPASAFEHVTGTEAVTTIGSYLTSTFGNWDGSGSTVQWGAAGADENNDEVWASRAVTTPWKTSNDQSQAYQSVYTIGEGNGTGPTAGTVLEATSSTSSWASFESVAEGGTGNSQNSSSTGSLQGYFITPGIMNLVSGNLYLTDLAEGPVTSGVADGYFNIDSTGKISFTGATTVPEPSTYALMLVGGILMAGVAFGRRANRA